MQKDETKLSKLIQNDSEMKRIKKPSKARKYE